MTVNATDPFVDMTFRVPASLLEQMRAYAREHDTTITAWVQDAIHSKLAAVVAERADSPVLYEGTFDGLALSVTLARKEWQESVGHGRRVRVVAIDQDNTNGH